MKSKTLAKIAGLIIIPATALFSGGCSSDTGIAFDFLKVKFGHQQAFYKESDDRTVSDQVIFEKDCEPYDKSEISNGAVEATAPIWEHYKNRQQNNQ